MPAFDHLRAFVIFLVVLHHAAMAYCTGGEAVHGGSYTNGSAPVVDTAQWEGFNLVVTWNDGFFMPLMFLLSGLFVQSGLARKGIGRHLADRALRLGVPLLVGIGVVIPLSYYAAHLQSGGTEDFGTFWARMIAQGPWPSGPFWFVGALLVFDTAGAFLLTRESVRGIVHRAGATLDRWPPVAWFLAFAALAALAYIPARAALGPSYWLTAGPFGIQGSRIGLYAFFFAAGVIVGAERLAAAFATHWLRWSLLAAVGTTLLFTLDGSRLPELANGAVLVVLSATMAAGLIAMALRFANRRSALGNGLGANAYGIYLLHWPIVLWLEYALLPVRLGAVGKGLLVLVSGFCLSWLASDLMRRLPGVARIV